LAAFEIDFPSICAAAPCLVAESSTTRRGAAFLLYVTAAADGVLMAGRRTA
jgi:hypothetical protein